MVIAVNTRFLLNEYLEGYGYFIRETLQRLVRNHPQHRFVFLFDRPFDSTFLFAPNVEGLVVTPAARHPLLWHWWYDYKIPAVLKKIEADVFVSADGFCSLRTRVPQCLVIHDLAFLHYPQFIPKSYQRYYRRNTPRFLQKARSVVTVSRHSKSDIIRQYHLGEGKITIAPNAARAIFQPVEATIKQQVKDHYTGGQEFFLVVGSIHPRKNLRNLLKAFSLFKKRQRSNMKLVLVGRLAWKYDQFLAELKTYKYRQDVVLTGYLAEEELVRVMGSAYALVYVSLFEGFGMPVVEAMQCGVPVITSAGTAMEEIAGDAALLADPGEVSDIAEKMMTIYKDESLRAKKIEQGLQVARSYTWEQTATQCWEAIQRAVS